MWIWRISLMFKSENSFSAQISLCIILFSKVYKVWSIIVKVLFILLFTYCLVSQFSFSPMMLLLLWVFWYGVFLSTIILQFKLWFLFRLSKSFAFYFFKFKAFFPPLWSVFSSRYVGKNWSSEGLQKKAPALWFWKNKCYRTSQQLNKSKMIQH